MSDSKKYYYLKLKDNYFDTDEMIVLESMPDGYLYSNILLKLYLRSLKYNGRLMFNEKIPFNSTMLAQVTRHPEGVIEKAMRIFKELSLVEIMDSGAIFMADIQNFIGSSSTEADRKRNYRKRIELEKVGTVVGQLSGQTSDFSPPEIEIDIELEKEIELETKPRKKEKKQYAPAVKMFEEEYQKLIEKFGEADTNDRIERLSLYKKSKGKQYKCDYSTILAWARKDDKTDSAASWSGPPEHLTGEAKAEFDRQAEVYRQQMGRLD